jgi:hypothetical protein
VPGSVKLGHRALRFAARKVSLTGGRVSKVAIKLPKGDARRVRAALKKHAKLTARLTVAMTAAAGDSRTLKLAIRLR